MLNLLTGTESVDYGGGSVPQGAPDDEAGQFTAAVLGSTEDVWSGIFAQQGARYAPPELTLFDGSVQSACGFASSSPQQRPRAG